MNVSISSFVPKPHTPFQWMPMESLESLTEKQRWIKGKLSNRSLRIKCHNAKMSLMEAVFSRGDRKLSAVLEKAFHLGCIFDGWSDQFNFSKWETAFQSCGVDPEEYARRAINQASPLPWDIIDTGVTKEFLAKELEKALQGEVTEICRQDLCHGCGAFADVCQTVMRSSDKKSMSRNAVSRGKGKDSGLQTLYRYRVKYEKRAKLRFLSHLDMTRAILRGLKRAGIPLVYSKGFHPKPKVSFGPALAVGIESKAEYFDFDSYRYLDEQEFLTQVKPYLTEGLVFTRLKMIPRSTPSLSETLNAALYQIRCKDKETNNLVKERMHSLKELSKSQNSSIPRQEEARKFFERIIRIDDGGEEGVDFLYHLRKGERVKVGDILKIILNREDWVNYIERKEMFVEKEGKFFSPLLGNNQSRSYVQRNDH